MYRDPLAGPITVFFTKFNVPVLMSAPPTLAESPLRAKHVLFSYPWNVRGRTTFSLDLIPVTDALARWNQCGGVYIPVSVYFSVKE